MAGVMRLLIKRFHRTNDDSLSLFFIEEKCYGFIPEDEKRDVKVKGETRIPAGIYEVVLEDSPKFGPNTLTVKNVPGYVGIRFHPLVNEKQTEGCIGVGWDCHLNLFGNSSTGRSKLANDHFQPIVKAAIKRGEKVFLTVQDEEEMFK